MTMTRHAPLLQITALVLEAPACRLALIAPNGAVWAGELCSAANAKIVPVSRQIRVTLRMGQALDAAQVCELLGADALVVSSMYALRLDGAAGKLPIILLVADGAPGAACAPFPHGCLLCPADSAAILYNLCTALSTASAFSTLYETQHKLQQTHDEQTAAHAELLSRQDVLEQSAREAYLIKNAIVRNVSHELKTPMLHLKSAISQLAEEQQTSLLTRYATNATARLDEIIQNIVQLSRWVDIKPEPMLLSDSVELALRALRRSWTNRDKVGRIDIRLSESLPPVEADKQGIATVLQLLIDNALKFSKKGVTVSVKIQGEQVVASVTDQGIGIPQAELSRIQNGFYQVDGEDTRAYGGVGIGLAIVGLILDRHSTHIEIRSEPEHGSTFSFSLPILPFDPAASA